jgi:hypothetical protein
MRQETLTVGPARLLSPAAAGCLPGTRSADDLSGGYRHHGPVQTRLRERRAGWAIVIASGALAVTGVGRTGLAIAVSTAGLMLVRGWNDIRSPTWFDDPFWRDWLYWSGVLPCALLIAIATATGNADWWSWIPPWLGIAVMSLVGAYPYGLLAGTIRAFVRGVRLPNRA